MKRVLATVILGAALLAGCRTTTVNPNALPPTFYTSAAKTMDAFSTILVNAQSLFTTAYQDGFVTAGQYQAGMKVFGQIAASGEAIDVSILAADSQASILAKIDSLASQIATMPQAFAIKNPQSQAAFTALTNSLVAVLRAVQSQLTTTAPAGK